MTAWIDYPRAGRENAAPVATPAVKSRSPVRQCHLQKSLRLLRPPINDPAASCGVLGYQRTQQAAGNGPVEIQAKGRYRDAVRSTQGTVVKCYGLKWISLMLLAPLP